MRAASETLSARGCPRACPPRSSSRARTPCASSSRATRARTARSTPATRRGVSEPPRRPWSRRSWSSLATAACCRESSGRAAAAWSGPAPTCSGRCAASRSRRSGARSSRSSPRRSRACSSTGTASARMRRVARDPTRCSTWSSGFRALALPASILERDVLRARLARLPARGSRHATGRGRSRLGGSGPARRARRSARAVPGRRRCRTCCRRGPSRRRASCTTASAGTSPRKAPRSSARSTPPPVAASPSPSSRRSGTWPGPARSRATRPAALRAFLAARTSRAERRPTLSGFRSRRQVPAAAVGRWSLLALPRPGPTPTERLKALAQQLLKRHGVLTRDAVAFEGVPGGFPAVYPVLRTLEEAGRIRRGYFVAGQGGLQFADPGALERLRGRRDPDPEAPQAVVLAAADPANPYGAALPWPKLAEPAAAGEESRPGARLARAAGAHLVLVDGRVAAIVSSRCAAGRAAAAAGGAGAHPRGDGRGAAPSRAGARRPPGPRSGGRSSPALRSPTGRSRRSSPRPASCAPVRASGWRRCRSPRATRATELARGERLLEARLE